MEPKRNNFRCRKPSKDTKEQSYDWEYLGVVQPRSQGLSSLPPLVVGRKTLDAFHSTKISEISGLRLNGTVKIPGKVFENLGIHFECTLFDGISGIIENFVFHSQEISGLISLPSVNWRVRGHLKSNITAAGRRSYDMVPCLPRSKGTAVIIYLAKLRAAQINC